MSVQEFLNQLHKATRKAYSPVWHNDELRFKPRNRNANTPLQFCALTAVARYNGYSVSSSEDGQTAAEKLGLSDKYAKLIMNISDGMTPPNGIGPVLKGRILKAITR